MTKLSQLRFFFIVYFVLKFIIDIAFVVSDVGMFHEMRMFGVNHFILQPVFMIGLIVVIDGILFAVGLWLFFYLLRSRAWARIVLLVVAWLTVVDALSGFLLSPQAAEVLRNISTDTDWYRVMMVDRLTDILGLIYFGYLIILLQFDADVKKLFLPSCGQPTRTS